MVIIVVAVIHVAVVGVTVSCAASLTILLQIAPINIANHVVFGVMG